MLWQAVYEGGVFRPTHEVHLPEGSAVVVRLPDELPAMSPEQLDRIYSVLDQRVDVEPVVPVGQNGRHP